MEDKNLIALRKVCTEAKGTTLRQFNHRLLSVILPVAPTSLKAQVADAKSETLLAFDERTSIYKDTDVYQEIRKELEVSHSTIISEINTPCSKYLIWNERKLR